MIGPRQRNNAAITTSSLHLLLLWRDHFRVAAEPGNDLPNLLETANLRLPVRCDNAEGEKSAHARDLLVAGERATLIDAAALECPKATSRRHHAISATVEDDAAFLVRVIRRVQGLAASHFFLQAAQ